MMEVLDYKIYSNKRNLEAKDIHIQPKASLLVAFYNNIKFFDIIFASIEKQTFKEFELIICDDGSRPDVVEHIHNQMKNTPVLVKHIWHEDKGFRKVESLNKALANSESDYMIFIDQDCILHPEFIREHYENRKQNTALSGRRVELSPFITDLITPEKIKNNFFKRNFWWMFFFLFFRKDNQWDKGIYIRNPVLRKFFNRKHRPIVGCNYSIHKSDLISVNGFDMRHTASGTAEDCDIEFRLLLNGIKIEPLCHGAVQYHMFHKVRPQDHSCLHFFEETKKNKIKISPFGYNSIQKQSVIEL